jgi:hypothetical protein
MVDQHAVAGPGRLGDGAQAQVTADGPAAVITLTLTQRGPLAGLVQALTGRLTRKNLALELEGFRRGAASAQA